jgi:hypothetical protein
MLHTVEKNGWTKKIERIFVGSRWGSGFIILSLEQLYE